MKPINNKFFQLILWYTLILNILVFLIDFYNFSDSLFTESYSVLLLLLFLLIIELILLFATIKLLKNQYTKLIFRVLLFYWVAQIIFFGIKGNTYTFTTGPEIAFYFRYVGFIESGYFVKLITREFSLHIFSESNRVYLGFNLIPILVSSTLIYMSKKCNLSDANAEIK